MKLAERPIVEPLFTSTHSALKFALNFTHGLLPPSVLAELMPCGVSGRGLSGLDGAAQAGMILAELERLTEVRRAMIVARLADPTTPCDCGKPCCRLWRENPVWTAAVDRLTRYVHEEGLGRTVSHWHLRRALVTRHFGQRVSMPEIAKKYGVNRDTGDDYYKRVTERFKGQEKLSFAEIDGYLKGAVIVG